MTKSKMGQVMAGALCAALLCGASAVKAQSLVPNETITVHPYGAIHSRSQVGGSGSMYSEALSMSRQVDYSDLDLTRVADARELRSRISDTARDICAQLSVAGDPRMKDTDDNQCVDTAIRDAIRQVPGGIG